MPALAHLSEIRRTLLTLLKQEGPASIAELAARAGVTYEAVRQQVVQLEADGWVTKRAERAERAERAIGRPTRRYRLTPAGDHLFAKHYDALAVELLDAVGAELGDEALRALLASLTEARVRAWAPRLEGLSLPERLEALKELYLDADPFTATEAGPDGLRLIERNCPFLHVAAARPALCSVTVSALTRLLGVRVVREERFQRGDGRCAFRVLPEEPVDPASFTFAWEPEA